MADALSIFPVYGNQETTQESTCKKRNVSEINDIRELPEGVFPIHLKLINQYQQKYPSLMDKY